jgi:membrane-associated phospholipid phosphatase
VHGGIFRPAILELEMSGSTVTDPLRLFRRWCDLLVFATVSTLLAILFLDGPVAQFFRREIHIAVLKPYAPSSHLISVTTATIGALIGLFCLVMKRFPKWAEAMLLSAVAAVASIHLADHAKRVAAHPGPRLFVRYLRTHFGWHSQGIGFGGFPSTHAALAAAALSVLAFYFPRAAIGCLIGALAIDIVLVAGGWHFVSDVLAGNMVGFTIAVLGYGAAAALKASAHKMRVT